MMAGSMGGQRPNRKSGKSQAQIAAEEKKRFEEEQKKRKMRCRRRQGVPQG